MKAIQYPAAQNPAQVRAMTPAIIAAGIFAATGLALSRFAKPRARRDIYLFAGIGTAIMLAFGVAQKAQAEPVSAYLGAEFGLDWPMKDDRPSPQCVRGDLDGLTSDGRVYAGIEWPGPFYVEADAWRHKSCALGDDRNAYDAFSIKFGARLEFDL